jgi:hypothetical protein
MRRGVTGFLAAKGLTAEFGLAKLLSWSAAGTVVV